MPFGIIDKRLSKDDEFLPGTEYLIGDQNVAAITGNEARQLKHVMYKVR